MSWTAPLTSELPSNIYTSPTISPSLDDLIGRPGKYVIGANQEEPLAEIRVRPIDGRDDLLVGRGARINDVRRLLEALELNGIYEQGIMLLDYIFHLFPAGRGPTSKYGSYLLFNDEPLG